MLLAELFGQPWDGLWAMFWGMFAGFHFGKAYIKHKYNLP